MEAIILFVACLFSFAAGLISFLFFFKYKKQFFFHIFLIMASFFLICTNSFYALLNGAIGGRIFICIFGGVLSLLFSYGLTGFIMDIIHTSSEAVIRKVLSLYSIAVLVFAIVLVFVPAVKHPSVLLNIFGIWIPAFFAVLIGIIFFKRIDKGSFRKEKWIITVLAVLNLALAFVIKAVPFVFIISVSVLIYHIFYRYYFSSPMARTEKTLTQEFINDFSITKREQEIILSLLEGKSNKELADSLFVSEKTIESHLANIYRKVGVKNRLELFSRLQK
ncbi:MAG: helix-turn-helix transcriptional regulator [Treponema sp.]|nr:helix-turn-helix transcriptional regulator [Treponema sp.]